MRIEYSFSRSIAGSGRRFPERTDRAEDGRVVHEQIDGAPPRPNFFDRSLHRVFVGVV